MARPLRIQYVGGLYHVTLRGNERKAKPSYTKGTLSDAAFIECDRVFYLCNKDACQSE